ncbi:MAG: hypothetical protein GX096_15610, partial [Clostridiales bacterium]|nr:hypothetical protein [Clostridiales bacterium]
MIRNFPKGLRRFGATAMSLILLVMQVVMPVAALAADPSLLPNVTIYYQLSAEESPMSQMIMANSAGNEYVYWGVLPQEAFNNPMSIDVQGNDPSIIYDPASGSPIYASPATSVDGSSMATTIQVYQDGSPVASFPVYLATVDMPPVEVEPDPISVSLPIYYVDDSGTTLDEGRTETYTAEGNYTVYADESTWTG